MSSSLNQAKTGKLVGAGADKKIVLGFKPRHVKVMNTTDRITNEKTDTMDADEALRTLAAGTATFVDGITLNSDGFTMLAAVAIADKDLHYVAYEGKNE